MIGILTFYKERVTGLQRAIAQLDAKKRETERAAQRLEKDKQSLKKNMNHVSIFLFEHSQKNFFSLKRKETRGQKKLFDCHLNAPILTLPSKASRESWLLLQNDLTSWKRFSPNKNKRTLIESWNWLPDTDRYRKHFYK